MARETAQGLAAEAGLRRAAFLRRDLVLADGTYRELDRDFELDRHQVVAADLPGAAGRDHGPDRGQFFFSAQRLTRRGDDGRGGIGPPLVGRPREPKPRGS